MCPICLCALSQLLKKKKDDGKLECVLYCFTDINECDNAVDNNCDTTTSICAETTCGFECIPCPGIYIIIHLSNLNRFDVIITRYNRIQ